MPINPIVFLKDGICSWASEEDRNMYMCGESVYLCVTLSPIVCCSCLWPAIDNICIESSPVITQQLLKNENKLTLHEGSRNTQTCLYPNCITSIIPQWFYDMYAFCLTVYSALGFV